MTEVQQTPSLVLKEIPKSLSGEAKGTVPFVMSRLSMMVADINSNNFRMVAQCMMVAQPS